MKVLFNACYGGFSFNEELKEYLASEDLDYLVDLPRNHPDLITLVETVGLEQASGRYAKLEIAEIPDGCFFEIDEYDGFESIRETWITVTKDELKAGLTPEKLELALKVSCIRVSE